MGNIYLYNNFKFLINNKWAIINRFCRIILLKGIINTQRVTTQKQSH